jgi:hypothetical protein
MVRIHSVDRAKLAASTTYIIIEAVLAKHSDTPAAILHDEKS